MKRKIMWVAVSCLIVAALLLGSCAPAVTEKEETAPPVEEEVTPPEEVAEVVTEEEIAEEEVAPPTPPPDTTPPSAITGLVAIDAYDGKVNLWWDKSTAEDFDHYNIYVSKSEIVDVTGITPIHQLGEIATNTYQVSGLEVGTKYYFAVAAVDKSGNEKRWVASVSATPTPTAKPTPSLKEYPEVILGKDNWLFWGGPINALIRDGGLDDARIERMVEELSYINNSLKEQEVDFLFVLSPDKYLIYPEFMPDIYDEGDVPSSYQRLSEALSKTDIDFIDCKPLLLEKKQETGYRLYYVRDTHWNSLGNFYVLQELLTHLSKKHPVPKFELLSVDTSETRICDTAYGNDLNYMIETLSPWREKGAPEPVYNVYPESQAPLLLWYGSSFSPPVRDIMKEGWPNLTTYCPFYGPFGFPLSLRGDVSRRLMGHKIVIIEIAEHYRQQLSRMLVPEPPESDLTGCNQDYNWQSFNFLQNWKPLDQCELEVENDVVLVKVNVSDFTPSFCTTNPLSLEPSRRYYLVIKIVSPAVTGIQAYFSRTTRDEYIQTDRRGQHIFEGDNTVVFEIPDQDEWGPLKNIRIHPGDKAGVYSILQIAIYSKPK